MTPNQQLKLATTAQQHTLYTRNILSVYYSASLADHQAGGLWYAADHEIARTLCETYGLSMTQTAGILAAVSPQNEWARNVAMAERYISTWLGVVRTAVRQGGYLGVGLRKVDDLLALNFPSAEEAAVILNGDKVRAFFYNIMGDLHQVCVDGHAVNIAQNGLLRKGITQAKSPTSLQYTLTAAAYEAAADEVGILPALMQAVTWVAYKGMEISK